MKKIFNASIACMTAILIFAEITVSGQNTQQVQTDNKPAEFKPSGTLWGYVFGDYYVKTHADSLSRGKTQYAGKSYPKNYDAFAFRRIYLGYDYNISEHFSAEFLLSHESDVVDPSGDRSMYIKAANIRWKNIIPNNDLVIGQMNTPLFALVSEKAWGYRNIEKTVADMRGFGSSNDFGIAWQGKVDSKGTFGYNFLISNGTAQKLETDKYKKFWGEIYAKLLDQKLTLDFASDYEPLNGTQSKTTVKGFAAYQTTPVTIGIEVVSQTQKAYATDSISGSNVSANIVPFGFSAWIKGTVIKSKLNYFARFDTYNPDTKFSTSTLYPKAKPYSANKYTENFITAGLDYTPVKNVHIEPNLWVDTYKSKLTTVSGKAKSDYDMTARLTFYYVFGK
ncbi:MAG TPA: hypothetical protein VMT63_10110 [Bacteroidales bacterium]|nr:hypothetical protein [Bacteroidales bacterium]